eukprot:TRINITY_DN7940_c0_g1_i1.p1 TRINITY_DN7940_c0_g1~~TRINITY_DN7940_c0_g1_i1.p1  ORF type:complete len:200 (-),score=49.10 TRINITY_DN7940_c0_g1_i1:152-751(-)
MASGEEEANSGKMYFSVSPAGFAVAFITLFVSFLFLFGFRWRSSSSSASSTRKTGQSLADSSVKPVHVGPITLEKLREFDGSDASKPILVAIKGTIYDVTNGRHMYGPGGAYTAFAGRDATRALAIMSTEENAMTGDLTGLSMAEMDALDGWEQFFQTKYPTAGSIIPLSHPTATKGGQKSADEGSNASIATAVAVASS